jgi:hypothetical protein
MKIVITLMLCLFYGIEVTGQSVPLVRAASHADVAGVRSLLATGANPNEVDNSDIKGWTPLMAAARVGSTDIAKALIAAHANVNATNEYGATAMDIAVAKYGESSTMAALLKASGGKGRERKATTESAQNSNGVASPEGYEKADPQELQLRYEAKMSGITIDADGKIARIDNYRITIFSVGTVNVELKTNKVEVDLNDSRFATVWTAAFGPMRLTFDSMGEATLWITLTQRQGLRRLLNL